MIKKLFIITSTIEPSDIGLTYSKVRSIFSPDERFRQTVGTITSIHNAHPDAKIVLLDSSNDTNGLLNHLRFMPNLNVVSLKNINSEIAEIVNTNRNKSLCECLMTNTYLKQYKKYVNEFDFIIKVSGRYNLFNFTDYFTEENKNKIFFKKPSCFKWGNDWDWRFHHVDLRHSQQDDYLRQYCTVLFSFATNHLDKLIDMNDAIIHFLKQPSMSQYDMEILYYYLSRSFESDIIETEWSVCGWDGTSGRFMYY